MRARELIPNPENRTPPLPISVSNALNELREKWRPLAVAMLLGAIGAAGAVYLTLPLPWMLGPMVATAAAAMSGVRVWIPTWLRSSMFIVMGIMFGAGIPPDIAQQMQTWMISSAGVVIFVIVTGAAMFFYYHRVAGYGPVTAYFSAMPGGVLPMTILGGSFGGDVRIISLMQLSRLAGTVILIPVSFRLFAGYEPTGSAGTDAHFDDVAPLDAVIWLIASIAAIPLAGRLRLPSPPLMGPLLAVGALTLAGVVSSPMPDEPMAVAQLIIGASVGAMYNGVKVREVGVYLVHGSIAGTTMVALALLMALAAGPISGLEMQALILGYAPGGFVEMALIGFALGIEVTFVITHQLVRFLFIVAGAPIIMSQLKKRLNLEEN